MHPASVKFCEVLDEMRAMHLKKGADYGTSSDPFANIRSSESFNIPAWLGAVVRLNDKVSRIKSFAVKGHLQNESIEDSLIDIAVYAAISLVLYRETCAGSGDDPVGDDIALGAVPRPAVPSLDESR